MQLWLCPLAISQDTCYSPTFPVAVTFLQCIKRSSLPILAISFSVRPNCTCHELSSAEIAVYSYINSPKSSFFLICIYVSEESFDLYIQPPLQPSSSFSNLFSFIKKHCFSFFAEACQGTRDMRILIIHIRQMCDSLSFRYIPCLIICILLVLKDQFWICLSLF